MIIKEFNDIQKRNICFTSRQMKGLRILDSIISKKLEIKSIEEKRLINEIITIKYIIEKSIIEIKKL